MVKKEGKIPCNCRVDIDYTGKKPKIKFGYTSKNPRKDAYKQCFYGTQLLILMCLFVLPVYLMPLWEVDIDYPSNCSVDLVEGFVNVTLQIEGYEDDSYYNNQSNVYKTFVKGANFTCDTGNYSVYFKRTYDIFESSKGFYHSPTGYTLMYLWLVLLIISIILVIMINKLLTKWLIKQKWYQKWIPKHNAGGKYKRKKYYKFRPKDVFDNVIVIPRFSNVELDYKTNGDFSKQLKRIRIREYRWHTYWNKKVRKLKLNNYRWYAVFYFKEKPKNGYLEVIYQ